MAQHEDRFKNSKNFAKDLDPRYQAIGSGGATASAGNCTAGSEKENIQTNSARAKLINHINQIPTAAPIEVICSEWMHETSGPRAIKFGLAQPPTLTPNSSLETRQDAFQDADRVFLVALLQVEVEFEPLPLLANEGSLLGKVVVEAEHLVAADRLDKALHVDPGLLLGGYFIL
jgi:hypothetical protein